MKIDAKITRDAVKALHKVEVAAARNFAAARVQKDQIAMGYWDRIAIAAANLAFQLRYGEDK